MNLELFRIRVYPYYYLCILRLRKIFLHGAYALRRQELGKSCGLSRSDPCPSVFIRGLHPICPFIRIVWLRLRRAGSSAVKQFRLRVFSDSVVNSVNEGG